MVGYGGDPLCCSGAVWDVGRGCGSGAPLASAALRLPPASCPCPERARFAVAFPGWVVLFSCRESGLACTQMKSMCGVDGVMLTRRERRALNRVPEARRLLGLEALTTPGLLQDRAATAARLRYVCAELLESPCGEPRDRLKAAELLARLDGAFAPERHVLEDERTRRTPAEMRAILAHEVGAIPAPAPAPAPSPAAGVSPAAVHTRDRLPDGAGSEQPSPVRAVGGSAPARPRASQAVNP